MKPLCRLLLPAFTAAVTVSQFFSSSASATLIIAHELETTSGSSGTLELLGDDIAALAGDVLVITAAKSKSLAYVYGVTSSDGGAASGLTHRAFDGTKTIDVVTFNITTGGTFDFSATPASTSFTTFGAYLLRADGAGESIALLDSDENFVGTNPGGGVTNTSSFSFAESSSGVVIDAFSSGSTTTIPTGLAGTGNPGNKRTTTTGTFAGVTSLSFDWVHDDDSKNGRTGGVAYAAISAVPEPTAALLFSVASLALLGVRQRAR